MVKPTRLVNASVAGRSCDIGAYRAQMAEEKKKKKKKKAAPTTTSNQQQGGQSTVQASKEDGEDFITQGGARDSRFYRNKLSNTRRSDDATGCNTKLTASDEDYARRLQEELNAGAPQHQEEDWYTEDLLSHIDFGQQGWAASSGKSIEDDANNGKPSARNYEVGPRQSPDTTPKPVHPSPQSHRVSKVKTSMLRRSMDPSNEDASVCEDVFDALTDPEDSRHALVVGTVRHSVDANLSTQEAEDLCIKKEKKKRRKSK